MDSTQLRHWMAVLAITLLLKRQRSDSISTAHYATLVDGSSGGALTHSALSVGTHS